MDANYVKSHFLAVTGRRHAPIVARAGKGYVWARRCLPGGAGWHPAPACIFIGYSSGSAACADAAQVAGELGWSASVTPGGAGSQVFETVTLSCPAFVLKVRLPAGVTGKQAFQLVATVCGTGYAWAQAA